MERTINFILTQDQIETVCNHFGVNQDNLQDFEICELLDEILNVVYCNDK